MSRNDFPVPPPPHCCTLDTVNSQTLHLYQRLTQRLEEEWQLHPHLSLVASARAADWLAEALKPYRDRPQPGLTLLRVPACAP